jgi:hypothetical protein
MQLAEKMGVAITLFTDILAAVRYKEWDYENFYQLYKQQLHTALANGHDVQLHIHPHWLTSSYTDALFVPSKDFCLGDFKSDVTFGGVEGVVSLAVNELKGICSEKDSNYECLAYRAGGYNMQPCTKEILKSLYRAGILFDSSVAKGYYFKSDVSEVNYLSMPDCCNWVLNPENINEACEESGILEIPIATKPKSLFEVPTVFKMKKYVNRAPKQHGSMIHSGEKVDLWSRIKMMSASRMLSFDNYTVSSEYLMDILKYNVQKCKSENELLLSVISHPKSMSDYSFQLMERFVEDVKKKYPGAEFVTYKDLKKCYEGQ